MSTRNRHSPWFRPANRYEAEVEAFNAAEDARMQRESWYGEGPCNLWGRWMREYRDGRWVYEGWSDATAAKIFTDVD